MQTKEPQEVLYVLATKDGTIYDAPKESIVDALAKSLADRNTYTALSPIEVWEYRRVAKVRAQLTIIPVKE